MAVQIRDQPLIRQDGQIVVRHSLQEANQRSWQGVVGHWAGLVPQRGMDAARGESAGVAKVVALELVRRLSLARPLSEDRASRSPAAGSIDPGCALSDANTQDHGLTLRNEAGMHLASGLAQWLSHPTHLC